MPAGSAPAQTLDPDRDYLHTFQKTFDAAFGWEVRCALELAIFRTFAVPGISEILDQAGEFAHRGQKRHDDTVALLREVAADGPASRRGRAAIRLINQIHRPYGIGNDDMVYVLATFVVVPVQWIARYGWRSLTEDEVRAAVNYYQETGRLMGIRRIPATYAAFAGYLDAYEREHHRFSEAGRRLAVSLSRVFEAWFPPPVRPLARSCVAAALGRPLRRTLGLPEPSGLVRAGVHIALRSRAALVRVFAPLRHRRRGSRQLRSYPCGYALGDLGPARTTGEETAHVPACCPYRR